MPFLTALTTLLGDHAVLTTAADRAPYERDWRGLVQYPALAVAFPKTTEQVSEIVKFCGEANIPIVPQGGNTGLVAGGVPGPGQPPLILNFARMNRIRAIDLAANYCIAEAGTPLAIVQKAAADANRLFPVSFAAEGSAQIGGVVSTNAGGMQVLSYGNMRAQILGLEVVLADGAIWHGLSPLPKNNTGYDLKQFFIGAEGTLGLITAASLRLYPAPAAQAMALVGVADAAQGMALFQAVRQVAGAALTLCEFMENAALTLGGPPPFPSPAYLLLEISAADAQSMLENALAAALENGLAANAVIAQSGRERQTLLALREAIPEGELAAGGAVKHDIAVPLSRMGEMVKAVHGFVAQNYPGCRPNIFGHLGDGNLHINIRPPEGKNLNALDAQKAALTEAIEALAINMGGSFSAEHGIGQFRLASMAAHKSPVELRLMRGLKQALDPGQIFNPGKVIPKETHE